LSSYGHGEDKRRLHAAGNHFILSTSQRRIIGAEMIADGLAVNDRSKRAAEVAHMITSTALLDHEVVARQPERRGIIELKVWLPQWQSFACKRASTDDERQIAEAARSVELTLQPRTFGSEVCVIG